MSINTSHSRLWSIARSILLSGVGSALLASCSNLGYSSDSSSPQSDAYTSDPEALAAEFSFPQASCGEQATQPSGTWYVVYIDGANPDEVRRKYCRDAIGTVRDKTGAPTVQVASLMDYSKALKLATAVGGEVETTVGQAGQSPGASASPTASPSTAASPGANTSSDTAYLTATDPGSSINMREAASTTAPIKQTGRSGDRIRIVEQQQGDDGRTWYKVSLQSGSEGWVRSDFVTREMASSSSGETRTATPGSTSTTPGSTTTASPSTTSPGTTSQNNGSYSASPSSTAANSYGMSNRTSSQYSTSSSQSTQSDQSASSQSGTYAASQSDQYSSEADQYTEEYSSEYDESSEQSDVAAGDSATLVSDNPQSRINVRNDASTDAPVQHIGYAGDPIHIIDSAEGEDGYVWYQVEFETGAVGWVRGDLVGE